MTESTMDRLRKKAKVRQAIIDEVAQIVWENGEMLADTEGGCMPSWADLVDARVHAHTRSGEQHGAMVQWWLESQQRAQALLGVDHKSALRLAAILIQQAGSAVDDMERQLWRQIDALRGKAPPVLAEGIEGERRE